MNTKVCAPSNDAFGTGIRLHESTVKKLQMRIVKAQRFGRHNKVKACYMFDRENY